MGGALLGLEVPLSCYHRYVVTDDRAVTLKELEEALQQVDPAYAIEGDLIKLGAGEYGIIDITQRGDPICDDDLNLLARFAEKTKHHEETLASLRNAKCMVTVQPLRSDGLEPLWDWLLRNLAGILAFEGGHFCSREGPLN